MQFAGVVLIGLQGLSTSCLWQRSASLCMMLAAFMLESLDGRLNCKSCTGGSMNAAKTMQRGASHVARPNVICEWYIGYLLF